MSDTTLFIIGVGVFGVAQIGAMWSTIPAETDRPQGPSEPNR